MNENKNEKWHCIKADVRRHRSKRKINNISSLDQWLNKQYRMSANTISFKILNRLKNENLMLQFLNMYTIYHKFSALMTNKV